MSSNLYSIDNLYVGIVSYYKRNEYVTEVHTLYDDMQSEELCDLDIKRFALPYESDVTYYKKSLVPYNYILYTSKINYKNVDYNSAIRIRDIYMANYYKFLKCNNVKNFEDLYEKEYSKKRNR